MVNIFWYWTFPSKVAFTAYIQTKPNVCVISEFLGFKTRKQSSDIMAWKLAMPCHSVIHDFIYSCIFIRLFTMIWECKIIFICLGREQQIQCLFYGAVNKYSSEFKCCDTNFNKRHDHSLLIKNNIKSKWSVFRRYSN